MDAVQEALGRNHKHKHGSEAGVDAKGGRGGPEWWTQLCANKHLTEDSTLKRVSETPPTVLLTLPPLPRYLVYFVWFVRHVLAQSSYYTFRGLSMYCSSFVES